MDNTFFSYHTLPNGLRVVHRPYQGDVEYCGVAVNAGSRDETYGREGLAHFVEHTIFKGTAHRRSWHIINRMEHVGGELNAYTTKEETVVYSCFPAGNLSRAADLIADLIAESVFPQNEIDREREVVADEIASYLDTPSEAVFDDFEELIFAGSSLAHNILGSQDTIRTFTPEVCRSWIDTLYTPGEMVFFYMGKAAPATVFRTVERYFSRLDHSDLRRTRTAPPEIPTFDVRRPVQVHQAHTVMGARIPGMYHGTRHPFALLANMLGGPGMNSLLNVALRERRGLVYSVEATASFMSDTGLFAIYFGCDSGDVARCRRLTGDILRRVADEGVSERQLRDAIRQYVGQMTVAHENREQLSLSSGRAMLFYGECRTSEEIRRRIESITRQEIMDAARMIVPDHCSVLTLG